MAVRNSQVRASDAEREEVVAFLRESLAEGRLTVDEFGERMDATYSAKTYGDLDLLMADLPRRPYLGSRTAPLDISWAGAQVADWQARRQQKERRRWSRYLSVNALLWTFWCLSLLVPGHHGDEPWPLLLTVPWGVLLVSRPRARAAGSHGRSSMQGSSDRHGSSY
jgi:Domain of unknown function (DUF1707)